MEDLTILCTWLQKFPGFPPGTRLTADYTDGKPETTGIFPLGLEEIRRKQTISGGIQVENREKFALYRVSCGQQDSPENARWLLQLQHWVQQQCALGLVPVFGENQHILAERGRLIQSRQAGTALYSVTITVSYTINLR